MKLTAQSVAIHFTPRAEKRVHSSTYGETTRPHATRGPPSIKLRNSSHMPRRIQTKRKPRSLTPAPRPFCGAQNSPSGRTHSKCVRTTLTRLPERAALRAYALKMPLFVYPEAQNVTEHCDRRASPLVLGGSIGAAACRKKRSRTHVGHREAGATSGARKQVNSHLTGGTCLREQCVMAIITIAFQRDSDRRSRTTRAERRTDKP